MILGQLAKKDADKNIRSIADIADFIITGSPGKNIVEIQEFIMACFETFFLASGASDNNIKSLFYPYLKASGASTSFTTFSKGKQPIARRESFNAVAIKADRVARICAGYLAAIRNVPEHKNPPDDVVGNWRSEVRQLLETYISLIFSESSPNQLVGLFHAYGSLKLGQANSTIDLSREFLKGPVASKVRGSVTASGGHNMEDYLRDKLALLGLKPGRDFNLSDVIPFKNGDPSAGTIAKEGTKSRAFDFILPYKTPGREDSERLYIQAQFYAGDSGSVSHKMLDQTPNSRLAVIDAKLPSVFVEYLDGAAFASSLRGDLERLLKLKTTSSFFQQNSILTRLRWQLRKIDFATPSDIAQAIGVRGEAPLTEVTATLAGIYGFSPKEIKRAIDQALADNIVAETSDGLIQVIDAKLAENARRLTVLDTIALHGEMYDVKDLREELVLIPGFGRYFGIDMAVLRRILQGISTSYTENFTADIEWLVDEGVVRRGTLENL